MGVVDMDVNVDVLMFTNMEVEVLIDVVVCNMEVVLVVLSSAKELVAVATDAAFVLNVAAACADVVVCAFPLFDLGTAVHLFPCSVVTKAPGGELFNVDMAVAIPFNEIVALV